MVLGTKVVLIRAFQMAKARSFTLTGLFLKVNGGRATRMGREFLLSQTDQITRATGARASTMAVERM